MVIIKAEIKICITLEKCSLRHWMSDPNWVTTVSEHETITLSTSTDKAHFMPNIGWPAVVGGDRTHMFNCTIKGWTCGRCLMICYNYDILPNCVSDCVILIMENWVSPLLKICLTSLSLFKVHTALPLETLNMFSVMSRGLLQQVFRLATCMFLSGFCAWKRIHITSITTKWSTLDIENK